MKAFHPLARLAVTAAVLVMLMFCRSVTAAAVGLVTGLCCIGLTDGRKSLLKWLGASLLTAFAMAVIDPLVSHRGMTVLLFVNGRAYTLESMLYGLELGLSLAVAILLGLAEHTVMKLTGRKTGAGTAARTRTEEK